MPTYRHDVPQYLYLYERPSADAFGVGQCLVAGKEYTSDGVTWSSGTTSTAYTWATKPTATVFGVGPAWFSDLSVTGYSDGVNWTIKPVPLRSSPVKIALYGDSNADFTTETDQNVSILYDTTFPASGTTTLAKIFNVASIADVYPQAYITMNAGIGGTTTQSWLDRDVAVASSSRAAVLDVISAGTDVVLYRGQSINDYVSLTAAQITSSLKDGVFTRWKTILHRLMSTGCVIIASGHPGYTLYGATLTADTTARKAALVDLNGRIRDYITTLNDKRALFINPTGLVSDSSGGYLPDMSIDGTHLSYPGAYLLGQEEKKLIEVIYGPSSTIRYPGTNLVTNQLLLTQTTEAYGTLATGFTITATNGTRSDAAVENIDGTIYQTVKIAPTGNGTDIVYIFLYAPVEYNTFTIVSGERYGIEYDTFIEMSNGSTVVGHDSSSYFEVTKTANGKIAQRLLRSRAGASTRVKLHPVFNPIQIDEASANISALKLYHLYTINAAQNTSTVPVKVGIGGVRVVKL